MGGPYSERCVSVVGGDNAVEVCAITIKARWVDFRCDPANPQRRVRRDTTHVNRNASFSGRRSQHPENYGQGRCDCSKFLIFIFILSLRKAQGLLVMRPHFSILDFCIMQIKNLFLLSLFLGCRP